MKKYQNSQVSNHTHLWEEQLYPCRNFTALTFVVDKFNYSASPADLLITASPNGNMDDQSCANKSRTAPANGFSFVYQAKHRCIQIANPDWGVVGKDEIVDLTSVFIVFGHFF